MFCHRFSLIPVNSRSSTILTRDIYPSLIFAGEALALQLAKGRTELVPIATMGYFSPLILPNLPAPTATMQDQVRTKKDFSPLCTCTKLLLHHLSQKRASSFTAPMPGPPCTTLPALQSKEGARTAGAAPRSTAAPADFSRLEKHSQATKAASLTPTPAAGRGYSAREPQQL